MSTSPSTRNPSLGRAALAAFVTVSIACQLPALTAQADELHVPRVTISLVRESSIPARDAGVLSDIMVTEGQLVAKGDVVAVLENDQQTLQLKAAELNLKAAAMKAGDDLAVRTAIAQLKEAESGRRVTEIALKIAEEKAKSQVPIRVAAAETKMRQLELQRAEKARSSFKGSISETELDRLRTAVEKGRLETERAENDYRIQQLEPQAEQAALEQKNEEIQRYASLVELEKRNLNIAGVNRDVYQNEVALSRVKLEQRNIRMPFDGTVVKVEAQIGEWVEPGAPVARVIDLKTLRAVGSLPAQQATPKLQGRPVAIEVVSGGKTITVRGTVTFVSPEVDVNVQQVLFWAEFDNTSLAVSPGMTASLTIGE